MKPPIVTIRGLSVTFRRRTGTVRALENINLDVREGEILAIIGESGSGKTTLGLMMQGLMPPGSEPVVTGSAKISGIELVNAKPKLLRSVRRHLVRAIPQDPIAALDPTMRIRKQLRGASNHGDHVADEWLVKTGLRRSDKIETRYPHQLSGGQRQRVLIAMAAMSLPNVLIADEPTTALDMATQGKVVTLLRDLAERHGTAVVFITHNLKIAAALADRILVLRNGHVVGTHACKQSIRDHSSSDFLTSRYTLTSGVSPRFVASQKSAARTTDPPEEPSTLNTKTLGDRENDHLRVTGSAFRPEQRTSGDSRLSAIDRDTFALKLNDISHSFCRTSSFFHSKPAEKILSSINLSIGVGECVALMGESGAGKTTLLRIAAGLTRPDAGSVETLHGVRPQIVFQDAVASFTPWLTIGEQIGERLRLLQLPERERTDRIVAALEDINLSSQLINALPGNLSVGQCQRAAVARALVVPPSVLLCDEPTSAMDQGLARSTLELLNDMRLRLKIAMLFITHDTTAADFIANRTFTLDQSKLVCIDPGTSINSPRLPVQVMPRLEEL